MKNQQLLDLVTELGYQLAMSGAETFRVEESINRILSAYGIESEVFAIPNCLTVSMRTPEGNTLTRLRRIGFHGNDLDSVEKYSNLSRKICALIPAPEEAIRWLEETGRSRVQYKLPIFLLGNFLGALGFAIFFGGDLIAGLISGLCGVLVGFIGRVLGRFHVNPFFSTMVCAFAMALAAYGFAVSGLCGNTDSVIIGALMILVPGLIFTNAMRDIIFGDTNSGVNRIVQVLMIAAAIALGTGTALNLANLLWLVPASTAPIVQSFAVQCIAAFIGCFGFCIIFNIHGPGGLLCVLGGVLTWASYLISFRICGNEITSYFVSAVVAAVYSEKMARVRKYPAISYLVVSIFPLIPGAGIYYTSNFLALGNMDAFTDKGLQTIGIAGAIAVGILSVSTLVRLLSVWKQNRTSK